MVRVWGCRVQGGELKFGVYVEMVGLGPLEGSTCALGMVVWSSGIRVSSSWSRVSGGFVVWGVGWGEDR